MTKNHNKKPVIALTSILAVSLIAMTFGQAEATEVDIREAIASRIVLEEGGPRFAPEEVSIEDLATVKTVSFEPDALFDALKAETGKPNYVGPFEEDLPNAEVWYYEVMSFAESNHSIVQINRYELELAIRDKRGYNVKGSKMDQTISDDMLIERCRDLLYSIGAVPEETDEYWVTYLMAADFVEPAEGEEAALVTEVAEHTVRRRAWKVFVERSIGGIPVYGDRMVFSFALNGGFRKMIGRWKRVDFSQSILGMSMDEEGFVERALDFLVDMETSEEKGYSSNVDLPITLGTHYHPVEISPGTYVLELRGYAKVMVRGPGDSIKPTMHSFELF